MLSDVDLVWIHPLLFIIFFCLYPNCCLFSPICVLNKAVNPLTCYSDGCMKVLCMDVH